MFTNQKRTSFRRRASSQWKSMPWLSLVTTIIIVGILLSSATSFWDGLRHSSKPSARASAVLVPRINVPFFTSAVPFNQTAIFWFGGVTSSETYTDVRIGYNTSELYIDLHIIDHYLWYDPNGQAPNLSKGDNASIYLATLNNGTSYLDQHSHKFQAAVSGYKQQSNYQKAYTGNGTTWIATNTPFSTAYGWRGRGLNGPADRGWSMTYHIPFSSLGMSTPPPQGTLWKLAVQVHNQDSAASTSIPDEWWPIVAGATNPSGWGDLSFGMPAYKPPVASSTSTYTVRNKLNNQVVTDGMVGGGLGCGSSLSNVWAQWGSNSHPGSVDINIQNEADISDWSCFSKFYITFPLSSLPRGKGLINAKVTLFEYGNAGVQGQPNPSHIQVAVVNQDWNPATLSWNSAPLEQENINSILVNTKSKPVIPWPGLAVTWDVSRAVAEAYAAGQPLRLVFYSTDNQYNSGKYFMSSNVGNWDANGRPTLSVALGT